MRVTFIGDSKDLETELKKVKGQLATVQKQVERGASGAKRSAEANAILGASFGSMAKRAAAGGAAIAATYLGISKAKDAIAATEDLTHSTLTLHKSFGLSVKSASEWGAVIKARSTDGAAVGKSLTMSFKQFATQVHNAGTAVTGQSVALTKLQRKDQERLNLAAKQGKSLTDLTLLRRKLTLGEADASTKALKQVEAFKALGISQQELSKHGNDMNYMLHAVSDGLGKLPAGTNKAAIMARLFGRTWVQVAPLIRDGSKALDQQLHTADKYGATLNDKILKQQERYIKSQREMQLANLGLKISFASIVTPALTSFNVLMAKVAKDLNGPGSFDDKMKRIGKDVHPALVKIEDEFHKELPKIASFAGRQAPKVAAAFVKGFIDTDIWGKIALGAFLITKLKAWGPIFKKIGAADGLAWGGSYTKTAAAEAAAAGEISAAASAPSMWSRVGSLAGKTFGIAFVGAAAYDISANLEKALHGSHGPNAGGRQSATSGGQSDFANWFQGVFGINLPRKSANDNLGQIVKGLGKSGGKALTGAAQRDIVTAAAQQFGIPAALLWGIYGTETGYGKNDTTSSAGAKGAFQFINDPATLKKYAYPYTNKQTPTILGQQALGAAHYIADLLKKNHGNVAAALLAYSGGGYSSVPGYSGAQQMVAGTRQTGGLKLPASQGGVGPGGIGSVGGLVPSGATLEWKRIDQGQDLRTDPGGSLLALGNGIVVSVKNNPGGFGMGYPVVKFTSGPLKGKEVYYGHTHSLLKAGQRFRAGDEITKTGYGTPREGNARTPGWAEIGLWGPNGPGSMTAGNAIAPILKRIASGQYKSAGPTRIQTGQLSEGDVLTFMQSRLDHFDLMVQAGLMSGFKAALAKRAVVKTTVPMLTGDRKLQALVALRGLPTERGIEAQGWAKAAAQYAAGAAARTVNASVDNPLLQAALGHTDNLVAAGQLTPAQGDALKRGYLTGALPSLTGENKLIAQGQIAGLTPSAVTNEDARLANIDLHQRAGDLSSSDATTQKIASLKDALDNWTLTDDERLALRAELGDLTTALNDNTDATQKQMDLMQRDLDLTKARLDQAERLAQIAQNETSTLGRSLLAFVNGGIGAQAGSRRGTPVAGSTGVAY